MRPLILTLSQSCPPGTERGRRGGSGRGEEEERGEGEERGGERRREREGKEEERGEGGGREGVEGGGDGGGRGVWGNEHQKSILDTLDEEQGDFGNVDKVDKSKCTTDRGLYVLQTGGYMYYKHGAWGVEGPWRGNFCQHFQSH